MISTIQVHTAYTHTHLYSCMYMYVHIDTYTIYVSTHTYILSMSMFTYFHIITYSLLTLTILKSWREESPTSEGQTQSHDSARSPREGKMSSSFGQSFFRPKELSAEEPDGGLPGLRPSGSSSGVCWPAHCCEGSACPGCVGGGCWTRSPRASDGSS